MYQIAVVISFLLSNAFTYLWTIHSKSLYTILNLTGYVVILNAILQVTQGKLPLQAANPLGAICSFTSYKRIPHKKRMQSLTSFSILFLLLLFQKMHFNSSVNCLSFFSIVIRDWLWFPIIIKINSICINSIGNKHIFNSLNTVFR